MLVEVGAGNEGADESSLSSESEEAKDVRVGRHKMAFLPPDVIRVWWIGEGSLADLHALFDLSDRWLGDRRFFVLADQAKMTGITADARRAAASDPRAARIAGLAILGASFQLRVLMTMMSKAIIVLSGGKLGKIVFVATEAEAFAWFDAERKRLGLG